MKIQKSPNIFIDFWTNLRILPFFAILIFLCGCNIYQEKIYPTPTWPSISPEMTDRSWLTGEPCKSPCWYGMVVGKTTKQDAFDLIRGIKFLKNEPTRETNFDFEHKDQTNTESKHIGYAFNSIEVENWECAFLTFDENILTEIYINLNYKLSLNEVVDMIGPPDFSYTVINGAEKINGCGIELVWLNRQLIVESFEWIDVTGRNVCSIYYKNGKKPLSNQTVNNVTITNEDFLKHLERNQWNGFAFDKE